MAQRAPPDPRFVLEDAEPRYLSLHRAGRLRERAELALEALASCESCPRRCQVARLAGETGVCETGRHAVISSAFAHHGEEDCLRGWRGSGTVFFAHCNLQCVFCQNSDISQGGGGRVAEPAEIAGEMRRLRRQGCHNINLVTPEHVVPQVVEALVLAVEGGLRLPVVYNTSAYDAMSSLRLLDGLVDVYMPDFKFWRPESARRYSNAADYPERAREAIREMHRQVGPLMTGPDGIARRGVLVRHLVMPGLGHESAAILEWLAEEISPDTFVNIMGQYRPAHLVGRVEARGESRFAEIDRRPSPNEVGAAYRAAEQAGLWRFDD